MNLFRAINVKDNSSGFIVEIYGLALYTYIDDAAERFRTSVFFDNYLNL